MSAAVILQAAKAPIYPSLIAHQPLRDRIHLLSSISAEKTSPTEHHEQDGRPVALRHQQYLYKISQIQNVRRKADLRPLIVQSPTPF